MVTLDARFQKRERLLCLYKATDMYWNYQAKKTEDDPSTPCSNLSNSFLRNFWDWPSVFFLEVLVQNKYSAVFVWFSPQNAYVSIRFDKSTNLFETN